MLQKPPNHRLFDPSDSGISPVLQCHQAAIAAKNGVTPPPSVAPVINFNGAFDFLYPLLPLAPTIPAISAPGPTSIVFSPTLLLSTHQPGPDMKLETFCLTYELSPKIIEKFTANDYIYAHFLHFVLIKELEEMGFTRGEIAALRDAVESWSALLL